MSLLASTSAPAIGNGHIGSPQVTGKLASRPNRSLSMSVSKQPSANDTQASTVHPDELFTKHTISEVKFVQQRLRADADAKQEELRLMVGERYRDLLQASTSIISIASSSERVREALEETKSVVLSQANPSLPQRRSVKGGQDTNPDAHLNTLQLLSAHVKLLLDAPEHLWRLIERKKYFPAAWLFLLARVVHRSLVREGEQEEGTWSSQGVDVLGEFPLVQRQWDVVSQFRSQIIHKATLSLREGNSSVEDTCATLLTLHLLDSRPLAETFSVFLAQRSKTLHSSLSWKFEPESSTAQSKESNGHPLDRKTSTSISSEFRRQPVNKIKDATHTALDAVSQTVQTARKVFQDESDSEPSLIRRVLEYIQSDSPNPLETTQALPPELYLTTQTLLATLPSSNHFLLLPPNLRSYKPYVDITSSSSHMKSIQFTQKLDEWFQKSCSSLQKAVTRWFADLQSVREVWSLRTSTKRWLSDSSLRKDEIVQMTGMFDEICRHRAIEIWCLKLSGSLESFCERLDSTVSSLNENSKSTEKKDVSPVDFLFQTPPLPSIAHGSRGPVDASFQKYQVALRRQLVGRTALLDDVLATLENCARTIQQDFAHVTAGGDEPQELVEQLKTTYRPNADALCADAVKRLEKSADTLTESSSSNTDKIVFLGRVSDELSSSSPFISEIGCQPSVVKDFRKSTAALYDRMICRWRTQTVSQIVQNHQRTSFLGPRKVSFSDSSALSGPSSGLVRSLLALCDAIQALGISQNLSRQQTLVQRTLDHFVTELTRDWDDEDFESLYDLAFLWKLVDAQGKGWSELPSVLEKRIQQKLPADISVQEVYQSALNTLAGTQTLLATLLPQQPQSKSADKFSALLPFGIPPSDQQFQPAAELAKPKSRFGLLLVGA